MDKQKVIATINLANEAMEACPDIVRFIPHNDNAVMSVLRLAGNILIADAIRESEQQ